LTEPTALSILYESASPASGSQSADLTLWGHRRVVVSNNQAVRAVVLTGASGVAMLHSQHTGLQAPATTATCRLQKQRKEPRARGKKPPSTIRRTQCD